jgi:hypothetical protein
MAVTVIEPLNFEQLAQSDFRRAVDHQGVVDLDLETLA